jgi:hypothetical protein
MRQETEFRSQEERALARYFFYLQLLSYWLREVLATSS